MLTAPNTTHWRQQPLLPANYDDLANLVKVAHKARGKTIDFDWVLTRPDLLSLRRAVRTPENAPMILALARHIFEHGTEERFYSQIRKYHHEGGKVYWSMDPTPETTDLINRCDEGSTYEARLAAGTLPTRSDRKNSTPSESSPT